MTNKTLTPHKWIAVLITLLMAWNTVNAQRSKYEWGAEAGPSLISLRGNTFIDQNHEPTLGFAGGLSFQYNTASHFSVRTGIAFERKGSFLSAQTTDMFGVPTGTLRIHINYNYLTVPLLLRYTFGKKIQYFVNAGPYAGYLLQQTFVSQGSNIPKTRSDNTSSNKRFDTGISSGIGLSIPFKTRYAFSAEIRNNLGLYNVSKLPTFNNGSVKTNATQLLLGFTYKLMSCCPEMR